MKIANVKPFTLMSTDQMKSNNPECNYQFSEKNIELWKLFTIMMLLLFVVKQGPVKLHKFHNSCTKPVMVLQRVQILQVWLPSPNQEELLLSPWLSVFLMSWEIMVIKLVIKFVLTLQLSKLQEWSSWLMVFCCVKWWQISFWTDIQQSLLMKLMSVVSILIFWLVC